MRRFVFQTDFSGGLREPPSERANLLIRRFFLWAMAIQRPSGTEPRRYQIRCDGNLTAVGDRAPTLPNSL